MKKSITLKYKNNQPLNAVVDYIFLTKEKLIENVDFVITKKTPTLFGSGEDTIISIDIKYINPTAEEIKDIKEIIKIAENYGELDGADEIDIILKNYG